MKSALASSLCALVLLGGCVARTMAANRESARFDELWNSATPLDEWLASVDARFKEGTLPGLDRTSTLLLAASLDASARARFPAMPDPAQEDEQPRGELLAISLRVQDGLGASPMLQSQACRWYVYAGLDEPWAPMPRGARLAAGNLNGAQELRIVFTISPDAKPLATVRHGRALEVTAWGAGLEVVAAEARNDRGEALVHWFHGQ